MTAVATTVTAAPAAVVAAPRDEVGLAFYVGLPRGTRAGTDVTEIERAVLRLLAEVAPDAVVRSATAGPGRARGKVVARLRDDLEETTAPRPRRASARARAAWGGRPAVVLDTSARELTVDGTAVPLAAKEYALLTYLMRHPRRALDREELLREVWRGAAPHKGTRTVDVHVRRLREKLGGFVQIVTLRGVGYRYDPTSQVVLVGSGDAG